MPRLIRLRLRPYMQRPFEKNVKRRRQTTDVRAARPKHLSCAGSGNHNHPSVRFITNLPKPDEPILDRPLVRKIFYHSQFHNRHRQNCRRMAHNTPLFTQTMMSKKLLKLLHALLRVIAYHFLSPPSAPPMPSQTNVFRTHSYASTSIASVGFEVLRSICQQAAKNAPTTRSICTKPHRQRHLSPKIFPRVALPQVQQLEQNFRPQLRLRHKHALSFQ